MRLQHIPHPRVHTFVKPLLIKNRLHQLDIGHRHLPLLARDREVRGEHLRSKRLLRELLKSARIVGADLLVNGTDVQAVIRSDSHHGGGLVTSHITPDTISTAALVALIGWLAWRILRPILKWLGMILALAVLLVLLAGRELHHLTGPAWAPAGPVGTVSPSPDPDHAVTAIRAGIAAAMLAVMALVAPTAQATADPAIPGPSCTYLCVASMCVQTCRYHDPGETVVHTCTTTTYIYPGGYGSSTTSCT